MNKNNIGFDRRLDPVWLDYLSSMVLKSKTVDEIKKNLRQVIGRSLNGSQSIRKTITVMMRLWHYIPEEDIDIVERSKDLLKEISLGERLWIYWGLIILRYPFVKDIAEITGRLLDLKGNVSASEIKNRIVERWGDRYTVKRTVQMVTETMKDFGFIKVDKSRPTHVFECLPRKMTSNKKLTLWFIEILLRTIKDNKMLPISEISRQYCAFGFEINMPIGELLRNDKLELRREGTELILVGMK